MLINLLPDFFAVLNSTDRIAAYHRYFDTHRNILQAYWANYVLVPTVLISPMLHALQLSPDEAIFARCSRESM